MVQVCLFEKRWLIIALSPFTDVWSVTFQFKTYTLMGINYGHIGPRSAWPAPEMRLVGFDAPRPEARGVGSRVIGQGIYLAAQGYLHYIYNLLTSLNGLT